MGGSLEGLLLLVMELTLLQGRGEGDERGRGWEGEGMGGSLEGLLLLVMELTLLQGRGEGVRGREGVGGEGDERGRG